VSSLVLSPAHRPCPARRAAPAARIAFVMASGPVAASSLAASARRQFPAVPDDLARSFKWFAVPAIGKCRQHAGGAEAHGAQRTARCAGRPSAALRLPSTTSSSAAPPRWNASTASRPAGCAQHGRSGSEEKWVRDAEIAHGVGGARGHGRRRAGASCLRYWVAGPWCSIPACRRGNQFDLLVAGVTRHDGSLVAPPAGAGVAEEDDVRALSAGSLVRSNLSADLSNLTSLALFSA